MVNILGDFLDQLGLDSDESLLYQTLLKRGEATIVELSQETGINRSKIYRRYDRLKKVGLIEEVIDERGIRLKVTEIDRLNRLISEEEQKLAFLKDTFPKIKQNILSQLGLHDPNTQVLFYRGVDGIRQMGWNVLRAEKEVVGYTYRSYTEVVGCNYYNKWEQEFKERKLKLRDILTCFDYLKI